MIARHSRGITLVELLVVVSILVLLGAMVVPNLAPNMETRRLREAARGVDVFLASAKARAITNGRPVGVMITPAENNPYAALRLSLAEMPEVYAGDFYDSGLRVSITAIPTATDPYYYCTATETNQFNQGMSIWQSFSPGDLVQIGDKGYQYQLINAVNSKTFELRVNTRGGVLPWPSTPNSSNPIPYKFYRQPVIYRSAHGVGTTSGTSMVYQMPPSTAIDLTGCIFPGVNFSSTVSLPRTIVFSPSGGVSAIYANEGIRYLPAGTIQLLVGKLDKITPTAPGPINDTTANWYDTTNYYVSVGHLTGQVSTTEVAPVTSAASASLPVKLREATAFTRETFASGGR